MRKIGVIGCGYVGLVTGVCLAELGNAVICMDSDKGKIDSLSKSIASIYEPGLEELIKSNMRQQRLLFVDSLNSLAECELIFVAVGTPNKLNGEVDLSQVEQVVSALEDLFCSGLKQVKVVVKSTVPVGTGNRLSRQILKRTPWLRYVSNPEFLREGSAVSDFMKPARVVVGSDNAEDAEEVAKLYEQLNAPIIVTDIINAELIKYGANAFLATKISFINEIANVCEEVGGDVNVVSHGMGLDPRINHHFLKAGIGYGGSCFPKDVRALKQIAGSNGYHFQLLSAVIEVNEMQKYRVMQKLKENLGSFEGKRIAVFGLAFKPQTDDIRNSVALELMEILLAQGADLAATDPLAIGNSRQRLSNVSYFDDPYEAAEAAQALVITTEDPLYMNLDWGKISNLMIGGLVIDGRNMLAPGKLPASMTLEQIGRRSTSGVARVASTLVLEG